MATTLKERRHNVGLDYKTAGVNKAAGYEQVALMKDMVKKTHGPEVLTNLGGFSGVFKPDLMGIKKPVLVSGTDGVGTKLMIAQTLNIHHTIGIDCVAMCVNDILCQGAKPLFFLDYIATGKLVPEKMAAIVEGVVNGCQQAGAALIGGETAEMPGMYSEDEYDLAGFVVGLVDEEKVITGANIKAGDVAIGLASSGVHSNGFSLVRAILNKANINYEDNVSGLDKTVGEILLTPTRIYAKEVATLFTQVEVKGIAHITGGGLEENLPRVLPNNLGITVDTQVIPEQTIFKLLQEWGQIDRDEMFGTFNMGVGLVIVVSPTEVETALNSLMSIDSSAFVLGTITDDFAGVHLS